MTHAEQQMASRWRIDTTGQSPAMGNRVRIMEDRNTGNGWMLPVAEELMPEVAALLVAEHNRQRP